MNRIPEPELMEDPEQVFSYGRANFEEPHSSFVRMLKGCFPSPYGINAVLDMGCGTGDITFRIGRAFSGLVIDAIDGSAAMLFYANEGLIRKPEFEGRIHFLHGKIQEFTPDKSYGLIVSNSLLHHIADPADFWSAVNRLSAAGTRVFIMDLIRPGTAGEARRLVETYSPDEPDILKRDFYNSLLAAFEIDEVKQQLKEAGLGGLKVTRVSDRHLIVYGIRD